MNNIFIKLKRKQISINILFLALFLICFALLNTQLIFAKKQQDKTLINPFNVIEFVNKERIRQNILPLQENELLDKVAQKKLDNMIQNNYFAHTSPDGIDPWEWFLQSGYDFAYAGENLATGFNDVYKQHQKWMNSPKHRQNILDKRFTHTGVAVGHKKINGKDTIITVQVFATPIKISVTSPNFTPETFEVPDSLFYKGIKDINEQHRNDTILLKAGSVDHANTNQLYRNIFPQKIVWWCVGTVTIVVIIIEYYIFKKKR